MCGSVLNNARRGAYFIISRVRMNIPSSGLAVLTQGVDGNIHTNWLALLYYITERCK